MNSLHVTSNGWDIKAAQDSPTSSTMALVDPNGNVYSLELTDIVAKDVAVQANTTISMFDATVLVVMKGEVLGVTISHSWFLDGEHDFPLDPESAAQVTAFIKGFEK